MWKIKIITKPRPIESEIKNLAGVDLQIVLSLELYLSKEKMEGKDCTKAYSSAFKDTVQRVCILPISLIAPISTL